MTDNAKVKFFDGIADKWDGFHNLTILTENLEAGLVELGVGPDETVLDVGCGTGNLTQALLAKLSKSGRVLAVDISPAMVDRARGKVADPRVAWYVVDAIHLPMDNESVDRVICFSVWPHFENPEAVTQEFCRVLRQGGALHVWHLSSRKTINEIHASAGDAVSKDVLSSAVDTAQLLEAHGLTPYEIVDDDSRYLVSATKPRIKQ